MAWEVTLLQDPPASRNLPDGDRMRRFPGRKPIRVPEHIARRCETINQVQGYDVFKIVEIKEASNPAPVADIKPVVVATPATKPKAVDHEHDKAKPTVKRIKPLKIRKHKEAK